MLSRPRRPRIRGLVTLRDRVRRELARGLDPDARATLRAEVERELGRIQQVLAEARVARRALAAPTRNAIRELEMLDFAQVPTGEFPLARAVRLRGAVAGLARLLAAVAGEAGLPGAVAAERDSADTIRGQAAKLGLEARNAVESLGGSLDQLAPRTREALRGLEALAAPGGAEQAIATVTLLRAEVAAWRTRHRLRDVRPIRLSLVRSATLWRTRERRESVQLEVSDAFSGAPAEVLRALVSWALGRAQHNRGVVEDWLISTRAGRRVRERDEGTARGLSHDLAILFDAINRDWFEGRLERPEIAWTRLPTFHKFGTYTYASDRIVLSSTLDSPAVPRFVVEYVLYHEMLHKALGFERSRGRVRGRAHTREFRDAEKRFPRADEATAFLESLGRRRRR